MGLMTRKPTAAKPVEINTPQVQPEVYKTAVYEEVNKPFQSMIAYVEGAPWSVDYYSQVVGKHSELKSIDTAADGVSQSYRKINNLEIRVTSPLDNSYNPNTGTMQTKGTGHIYGGVVPNVEDHFVTETADRELTIFKIESVEALTASRDTVYEVSYFVVGRVSEAKDIYRSLEGKIGQEYHFVKNRINEGNAPLVVKEDFHTLVNLKQKYVDLLDFYMNTFWSKANRVMALPGQSKTIYDYNVVEFLFKIVDPTEHNNLLSVTRAPNVPSIYADQHNLFDALIRKSYAMIDQCNWEFGLVRSDAHGQNSFITGPYFFDIDYLIYPKNPDTTTTSTGQRPLTFANWTLEPTKRRGIAIPEPENDVIVRPNCTSPLIYNACKDNYYVLSKEFYTNSARMSGLEILVRDYLKNSTLDLNILGKILDCYSKMVRMDQFYYGPILLLLIKEASRKVYS